MNTEEKRPFYKTLLQSHTLKIKIPTYLGVIFIFLSALLYIIGSVNQTKTDYFAQVGRFAQLAPVFQEIATNFYFQSITYLIIAVLCFSTAYFFESRR